MFVHHAMVALFPHVVLPSGAAWRLLEHLQTPAGAVLCWCWCCMMLADPPLLDVLRSDTSMVACRSFSCLLANPPRNCFLHLLPSGAAWCAEQLPAPAGAV
jgi:hypothetical protein